MLTVKLTTSGKKNAFQDNKMQVLCHFQQVFKNEGL